MTRPFLSFVLFSLLSVSSLVFASPIVTIGQTTVFTEFNYRLEEGWPARGLGLPMPTTWEAVSKDNIARAALTAEPNTAGEARALTGVLFDWDFQGHTFPEVRFLPVSVTFDFDYEISANWILYTGSANAGVSTRWFGNSWGDFMGFETEETGSRSNHVVITFTTRSDGQPLTVRDLNAMGRILAMESYGEAHTAPGFTTPNNNSLASVSINSITVSVASIPEPSTLALFGLGLAGLAATQRRKQ